MIRAQISTSHGVFVRVDSSPDNNDSMVCLNITDVTSRHGMWLTEIEIDDTSAFVPLRTDFFQEKEAASSTLTRIQLSPASNIFILQPTIALPITFLRSLERLSNSATTLSNDNKAETLLQYQTLFFRRGLTLWISEKDEELQMMVSATKQEAPMLEGAFQEGVECSMGVFIVDSS